MDSSKPLLRLLVLASLILLPMRLVADDTVYTKVDVNPVPVKTPPPVYPPRLKVEGASGVVAVTIVIDETGTVTSCKVAKSTRDEFNDAAVEAVQKWKFKPAQKDGAPVKIKVTVPIRFSIEE